MQIFNSFFNKDTFNRTTAGWIITIVNAIMAVNSTWFFIFKMNSGLTGWLMINSCAPSIFIFVIGFLSGSSILISTAAIMMLRWGFLGLFFFSWSGYNIITQVSHIFMTIAIFYTIITIISQHKIKSAITGIMLGLVITVTYSIIQDRWFDTRPGYLEMFFQGQTILPKIK